MNKLLAEAIAKVQALPSEMQEQAARILLTYAGDEESVYQLTPEERPILKTRRPNSRAARSRLTKRSVTYGLSMGCEDGV